MSLLTGGLVITGLVVVVVVVVVAGSELADGVLLALGGPGGQPGGNGHQLRSTVVFADALPSSAVTVTTCG